MTNKLKRSEIFNLINENIQIGIAPINWSNDDMHEVGGHYSLDTILSEMMEAGYKGTEIGNKFPSTSLAIKKELEKYDLALASSWHSTFFLTKNLDSEIENIKKKCALLSEAGANIINVAECSHSIHSEINIELDSKPICDDQKYDILSNSLNNAGEVCKAHGVDLAFHHHMGTYIQNENEIEMLLSKTDPNFVHLCADTGHLLFAGVEPVEFFQKHINRIKHIHFKDIRADIFNNINLKKESFLKLVLKGIFTVPGDGCIDFITIGNNLKNSGYKGWIIVEAEQDPEKANPLEYALLSKKYLDKIWSD